MLYPVYYIIRQSLLQQGSIPITNNILALQVDATNASNLSAAYRAATALDATQYFCLYMNGAADAQCANDLTAFLFFPNYHNNPKPVVLLKHEVLKKFDGIEEILRLCAKAQGFTDVRFQVFPAATGKHIQVSGIPEIESVKKTYRQLLHQEAGDREGLFIELENLAAITLVEQALNEEVQLFKEQLPALFILTEKNHELQTRLHKAVQLVQAATQEIRTQAAHMETLRSQSQATSLQQYYNNEYEVLPLWYKRFGHILKAIMGKRRFKSLFTDNAKKYYD